MAVKKEWVCMAHGNFEADAPVCPAGCTTNVERVFLTAPAGLSEKTKVVDTHLQRLAASYGYTDLSNRNGSVAASSRRSGGAGPGGYDLTPRWEAVPKGDIFHAGGQIEKRDGSEGGASVPAGQYHTGEAIGPRLGVAPETLASNTVALPLGRLPPKPRPHVVAKDNTSADDFRAAVSRAT